MSSVENGTDDLLEVTDFQKHVGHALQIARELDGFTQEDLASRVQDYMGNGHHVDQSYLSKVESGAISITWVRFYAVCAVLGWRSSRMMELVECVSRRRSDETNQQIVSRLLRGIA